MALSTGNPGELGEIWTEIVRGLGPKVRQAELEARFRLVAEGSVQDRIFQIQSGKIKLTRVTSLGRDNLLEVLGPGDVIGLGSLSVVSEGPDSRRRHFRRAAERDQGPADSRTNLGVDDDGIEAREDRQRHWFTSATTLEPVQLNWVEIQEARDYLDRHPNLAIELLRAMNRDAERRYQRSVALRDVDVPGRIAAALLELMERFGEPSDTTPPTEASKTGMPPDTTIANRENATVKAQVNGVRLPYGLTQMELAQMSGASRETVNKVLADFISRGWIDQKRRSIIIQNEERLRYRSM